MYLVLCSTCRRGLPLQSRGLLIGDAALQVGSGRGNGISIMRAHLGTVYALRKEKIDEETCGKARDSKDRKLKTDDDAKISHVHSTVHYST